MDLRVCVHVHAIRHGCHRAACMTLVYYLEIAEIVLNKLNKNKAMNLSKITF